jgi:signal transduction histidine kinase/DNA-binding response OmpR family regulator
MKLNRLFIFLVLLCLNFAKAETINFNHFRKNSLFKERVLKTITDQYNLVWYITKSGVFRLDRFGDRKFETVDKNGDLIEFSPRFLFSDKSGDILIADCFSIYKFDWVLNKFIKQLELKIESNFFNDRFGTIYASNLNGLYKYDNANVELLFSPDKNFNLERFVVFCKDDDRILFRKSDSLLIYNYKENKVLFKCANIKYPTKVIELKNFYAVSSFNKLRLIDKASFKITDIQLPTNDLVVDICNVNNNLWVALDNNWGVYKYNSTTKNLVKVNINTKSDKNNRVTIKSISYHNGIVWLGSVWDGIFYTKFDSGYQTFQRFNSNNSLSINKIPVLLVDSDNTLYIGTDGKGLNIFNPERTEIEKIEMNLTFVSMLNLDERTLLLGAYRNGLYKFDKVTKKITKLLGDFSCWEIVKLNDHKFLLSIDNALVEFNDKYEIVYTYKGYIPNSLSLVTNGKIHYFSGLGGVRAVNTKTKQIEKYILKNMLVYDILRKDNSRFWIGTNRGLYELDLNTKEYTKITNDNREYLTILKKGNVLWLGTSDGVFSYDINQGLLKNRHLGNDLGIKHSAVVLDSAGQIYIGGNNGLLSFNPEILKNTYSNSEIILTDLVVHSKNKNSAFPLSKSINDYKSIDLEYNQSTFYLKFSQTNFGKNFGKTIYYKFEPQIDSWKEIDGNRLNFYSLKAGKYTVKIKIGNSSKYKELKINVLPPWWNTLWAQTMFFLLFLATCMIILAYIHHKKEAQAELEQKKREEELYKQKFRYFTNISHEIRTPLSLIEAPLKKVIEKGSSFEIDVVNNNIQRLNELVDKVLNIQKIDFDVVDITYSKLNIVKFIREISEKFQYLAELKDIDIVFESKERFIEIWFDKEKMSMIIDNLLNNAIKYSNSAGKITVKVEEYKGFVKIDVQDRGVGINDDKVEKIFDRFYQVDGNQGGAGVGLSIVKHFVDAHKGKISVKSVFGEGTCFSIQLLKGGAHIEPGQKMKIQVEESINSVNKKSKSYIDTIPEVRNKKILLVEDDIDLGDYLKKCFDAYYITKLIRNGAEAVEYLKNNDVHLVVSDVILPAKSGLDICTFIKENKKLSHIPILLLTGKSESDDVIKGFKNGADAYITKPFDLDVLYTRVSNLIKNRSVLKDSYLKDLKLTETEIEVTKEDELFIKKAIELVELNMNSSSFDVNEFVSQMGFGRTLAYKKVKEITGQSIKDFILTIRLKKAAALLIHTTQPIVEVAELTGFHTSQYFSTLFKKQFNVTPTNYRKSMMKN